MKTFYLPLPLIIICLASCTKTPTAQTAASEAHITPTFVTDTVKYDTDDPAIWINFAKPEESIIVGTDKDEDGALYAFDLEGHNLKDKKVKGLKRPNNVDIAYGLHFGDTTMDIAVVTERMTHRLRIFSLPDLQPVDNGGIEVFEGETQEGFRDLMGIALYTNPSTKTIYAIVGRKTGPTEAGYLWEYRLTGTKDKKVVATLERKFGKYSGKKEIESIAVDNELGYVYYSDEGVGIRKYYADAAKSNEELAVFGTKDFTQDHEGISIYKVDDTTGYLLVSDQQADRFNVYAREGSKKGAHDHQLLKSIFLSTRESDGSDVISIPLNAKFKHGLFVAMSTDKTFQLYKWEDLAGSDLKISTKSNIQQSALTK